MRNVWTVLVLMASAIFLSHCGDREKDAATVAAENLGANACVAGTYTGEGDIRWNSMWANQDFEEVAVAFADSSALVRVKGEAGDVVCTHYEGVQVEADGVNSVIKADRLSSVRVDGSGIWSNTLAQSLSNSIQVTQSTDACTFSIGSISPRDVTDQDSNSIQSANLERVGEADYNALLSECSALGEFVEVLLPVEEVEEEETEEEA